MKLKLASIALIPFAAVFVLRAVVTRRAI